MAKKDNNKQYLLIAVLAVVVYFAYSGGLFDGTSNDAPVVVEPVVGACGVEDVAFTPKITRLGKAGTSLSTVDNNYFVITDSLGSIAANAAKTVPINYDMQVMYGENSSTYYTVVKSTNTGCSDPKYESISLALADTSINPYARNSDGSVNGAAATQAVGADEEYDTTVTFKVGSDLYFGNPSSTCENMAVVEYDRTYILRVEGDTPKAYPGNLLSVHIMKIAILCPHFSLRGGVSNYYNILKTGKYIPAQQKEIETVKTRIKFELRQKKEEKKNQELIEQMRQEYSYKINESVFRRLT